MLSTTVNMPGYHDNRGCMDPRVMQNRAELMEIWRASQPEKPRKKGLFSGFSRSKSTDKFESLKQERQDPRGLRVYRNEMPQYPSHFDSLKLLGTENDASYLDSFMGRKVRHHSDEDNHNLHTSQSSGALSRSKKSSNRSSMNLEALYTTALSSLKSSQSDDDLYESLEVINYRKQRDAAKRAAKLRHVDKSGHPLFDHLRVETALHGDAMRKRKDEYANVTIPRRQAAHNDRSPTEHHRPRSNKHSDGSNSNNSSSDEFDDTLPRSNQRISRTAMMNDGHKHNSSAKNGSDSDEDWLIPRPRLMEDPPRGRSHGKKLHASLSSSSTEESDGSSKSQVTR